MLTLHVFGPRFGTPDASPFCIKAMSLLKMSGLAFRTIEGSDPRKAPKRKIPWLDDDGKVVADSTFIRMYLEDKYGIDFDPGLDATQKAVAWAFEKMCEEHLYFCAVHERWMKAENFDKGPRQFFDAVPGLLRPVVITAVRRQVARALFAQGIGRHADDDIIRLAKRDLQAVSDQLGDQPYFMGPTISGIDATIHAFVAAGASNTFDGPLREAVHAFPNLIAFRDRLNGIWYSEFSSEDALP